MIGLLLAAGKENRCFHPVKKTQKKNTERTQQQQLPIWPESSGMILSSRHARTTHAVPFPLSLTHLPCSSLSLPPPLSLSPLYPLSPLSPFLPSSTPLFSLCLSPSRSPLPFPVAAAAGWGGAWGVWSGPGLVWMRCGVFAAAQLWGGRLLAAGHRSSSAVCRC